MKKRTNQSVNGHLRTGAFLLLLIPLLAVCIIPFAHGQRNIVKRNVAAHSPNMTNVYGTAPAVAKTPKLIMRAPVGVVCPATITESTSQTIVDGNSVSCNNGVETVENHYWRAFDMNTFTGGQEYDVTSVSFGIELAVSGTGTGQPLTVNLYANHGAPFPGGDWQSNLIGTTGSINIPDQSDTIFETNLSAVVPAGTLELVMEVMTPDETGTGSEFFIGSNTDPETGPSYLSAADCGVPDPTPVGDLGFPDMHIVMNVNGSCPAGSPTPTPTATATATASVSPTPTPTATATATPRTTPTPRPRPTPYPRPTPPTASPTPTTTPSGTPSPSATATPTATPSPSATPRSRPMP